VANSILSLGIFQPLGKLSYNVYLVHIIILTYHAASARVNYFADDYNVVSVISNNNNINVIKNKL